MSEENISPSEHTEPPQEASANHALSTITTLLEEIQAKKTQFDELVASSTAELKRAIESATSAASRATADKDSIQATKVAAEANQTAIEKITTQTGTSLSEVEKLKTSVATMAGAIEATQKAASDDLGIIRQVKADVEVIKSSTDSISKTLSDEYSLISEQISSLQKEKSVLQNILADLTQAKTDAETNSTSAKIAIEEINAVKAKSVDLSAEVQKQQETLNQKQSELQNKITEIEDANNLVQGLRRELLEGSADTPSVQEEISNLQSEFNATLAAEKAAQEENASALNIIKETARKNSEAQAASIKSTFSKLHTDLEQKILALLPSAGAAGLASTYYDAKSRYAPTSYAGKSDFDKSTGFWNFIRRSFGNNPSSLVATFFFYALFILPLIALAYGTYELVIQLETNKEFVLDYKILLLRFLIAAPLATISVFGFTSLRLYRKLYEEYNHKQRVMELYRSFREEIEKSGDEEQIKELLKIMLDSVSHKAWDDVASSTSSPDDKNAISNLDQFVTLLSKVKTLGN